MEVQKMKKSKPIKSTAWVKLSENLKEEYETVNDLQMACEEIFSDHCIVMIYNGLETIGVYPSNFDTDYANDHRIHLMRDVVWYENKGEKIKKMDSARKIEAIVEAIQDKVDVQKLLIDRLNDSNPEELQELFERAVLKKGAVKEKEGCYKLLVGGKRGKPYEFAILE